MSTKAEVTPLCPATSSIAPPKKPFDSYRWRWATLTPTEGLNEPPILLGVLRVLAQNEGRPPSAQEVNEGLERVESDVRGMVSSRVRLPRSPERNLIRNSGQYWKGLGLLADSHGEIALTDFGRRVARGAITKDEFAAVTVRTLMLPNRRIESDATVNEWVSAGLSIKPLKLILQILGDLRTRVGSGAEYLTPFELYRILIPLAATRPSPTSYADALDAHRRGDLDVRTWPDCTPRSNDKRMAREFLLFLWHYGYVTRIEGNNETERYELVGEFTESDSELLQAILPTATEILEQTISRIRAEESTGFAQRRRVTAEVTSRPNQAAFRNRILRAYRGKCLITGESVPSVLIACHIIPVEENGSDSISNGFCLRVDIHTLFDAGDLRIAKDGSITLSEGVRNSPGYQNLPRSVRIPEFIERSNIEWRWNYH